MKKTKLFIASALLVFISLLLWNCQTDEDESIFLPSQVEQSKRIAKTISLKDLPFSLKKNVNLLDEVSKKNKNSSEALLMINEDQIIEVIDSLSNSKYSIKIQVPNQPENVLFNLVLGVNSNNEEITPFVLKYEISNPEEVYADLLPDFSKMRGTISEYDLNSFIYNLENSYSTNRTEEADPCDRYTTTNDDNNSNTTSGGGSSTGGGGTSGTGSNGSPGSGNTNGDFAFPEFENADQNGCDITSYSIWSNGTTGEVIGITWNCADGTSGSSWSDRTTEDDECPGDGDVAINDREDVIEEPDNPIEDMESYLDCFNTSQGATVTIYADQPNPDNPNDDVWIPTGDVGHAFISIEQNGHLVSYGFYPASGWGLLSSTDGVMGDDQNHEFHVSASISISGSILAELISESINFSNASYNLQGSNCTSFVVSAANIVGFDIPLSDCIGSYGIGMSGPSPARLGGYMRDMDLPPGATMNTLGGTSPDSNPCN